MFHPDERVALFIDGPNLYRAMKVLGWQIDYKLLRAWFEERCRFVRPYYYSAVSDNDTEYNKMRPLLDMLDHNGYTVRTKPVKTITDYESGQTFRKGNMDVEIAVDMLRLSSALDHVALISGDGDFRYLLQTIQDNGCRASVLFTAKGEGRDKSLADELRRQADNFIELDEMKKDIAHIQDRVKDGMRPRPQPVT